CTCACSRRAVGRSFTSNFDMSDPVVAVPTPKPSLPKFPGSHVPFGVNEMRLSAANWLIVIGVLVLAMLLLPRIWKRVERFPTGSDYRIPYELSKDYWLYQRRLGDIHESQKVFVLGDSVVWGEYVRPDGTLSHFLNTEAGKGDRFVNAGVNGL